MTLKTQTQIYQNAYEKRSTDRLFPFPTLGAYAEPFATWATEVLPADSFIRSDQPLEKWREHAHAALTKFLGRVPARPKLAPESLGSVESNDLRIERLRYQ